MSASSPPSPPSPPFPNPGARGTTSDGALRAGAATLRGSWTPSAGTAGLGTRRTGQRRSARGRIARPRRHDLVAGGGGGVSASFQEGGGDAAGPPPRATPYSSMTSVCIVRSNSVVFNREDSEWCDSSTGSSRGHSEPMEVMDLRTRARQIRTQSETDLSSSLVSIGSTSGIDTDDDLNRSSLKLSAKFVMNSGILNARNGDGMFPVASLTSSASSSGDKARRAGRRRGYADRGEHGGRPKPPKHWATSSTVASLAGSDREPRSEGLYAARTHRPGLPDLSSRNLGDAADASDSGSEASRSLCWSETTPLSDEGGQGGRQEGPPRKGASRARRCAMALLATALLSLFGGSVVVHLGLLSADGWVLGLLSADGTVQLLRDNGIIRKTGSGGPQIVHRSATPEPSFPQQEAFPQHYRVVQGEAQRVPMQGDLGNLHLGQEDPGSLP